MNRELILALTLSGPPIAFVKCCYAGVKAHNTYQTDSAKISATMSASCSRI
jgi:hypothetical protein